MNDIGAIFWTVIVFASMAWYGLLLFYVGYKGSRDLRRMIGHLRERKPDEDGRE